MNRKEFMKNEQNRIGLVIADDHEIQSMNEFVFIKKHQNKFIVDEYEFKNKKVFVINSRIGLVNATIATQYLIDIFKVNQIWNYGAVGSTGKYNQFDVVIPERFYFYDVITPWYKRGQTPGEKEYYLNSLLSNEEANIASGNSFIDNKEYIDELNKELDIHLIDMESAAIAQTCDKNNIPFYCVKAISDVIGSSNTNKIDINEAINKSSKLAFLKMIDKIEKNKK